MSNNQEDWYPIAGISLALGSALLIGSAFVMQKKGLLETIRNDASSTSSRGSHFYLKSRIWWVGMISCTLCLM